MKTFCLPPAEVQKFKQALLKRQINISDLINMDTPTRVEYLKNYAGELAPEVNKLFEQKLVLKSKMRGIINWASKMGEVGRYSPEKEAQVRKMISDYKSKQFERTFSPKEDEAFLNDLADAKIGTHITREEAQQIFDLSKKAETLKANYSPETGWKSPKDKLEYGFAQIAADKYINSLKEPDLDFKQIAKRRAFEFKDTYKENKVKAVTDLAKDAINQISDNSIALVASIDNSFIGRQGLKTLQTHPTVWARAAAKSFNDIYTSLRYKHGNEMAKDILHADMVSRPDYMNGTYQKAGIIAKLEEQYPSSMPARTPVIGRAFKASEVAFTNTALRMRMNTFDLLKDIATKNGVPIDDVWIKDVGKLVNNVTSRAPIGEYGVLRVIFWAPKMMWSQVNVLTAHFGGAGLKTSFARKQAAYNLMKIVATTGTVAAVLNAIDPGSVEIDPRSSDFLKYRRGNTRIDFTGGSGSYITLIARALTGQSKNATTKIVKELNSGKYGDSTVFDVGIDFLINKTTPLVRTGIYIGKGKNFEGEKPSVLSTAKDLTIPIPVQNIYENLAGDYKDASPQAIAGSVIDAFGLNANTYQNINNWDIKQTKEMKDFKRAVGEDKFRAANVRYNKLVNMKISQIVETQQYQKLSEEEKQKEIDRIKREAKQRVMY